MLTLTPAYGRDYKTVLAVKTDWLKDRDFLVANLFHKYDGKPTNRQDCKAAGETSVMIRFNSLMKTTVIKL